MQTEDSLRSPWNEFVFYFLKNRGAVIGLGFVFFFCLVAVLAPLLSPFDPAEIHDGFRRLPPRWFAEGQGEFWLGTDDLGRDLLSRLIYGARVSMGIGFFVVAVSLALGASLGLLAGYRGGWIDTLIMRMTDVLMALPSMLLAIVVVAILGPNLINAIFAVSLVEVPKFVRIIRAAVMGEKAKAYVTASRSFGASHWRQAVINILPNCMAPIIVQATLVFSEGILNAAALGFLGLGAQPPTSEWGSMLSDARSYITDAPWQVTLPGLCILIVVLGFNLFGDGLRDAFDPRLKQ